MSEEIELLEQTLDALFARHCGPAERTAAAQGLLPERLWARLVETGLTDLGAPDSGAGLPELVAVAMAVGRAAAPVPLAEASGLASWLLGATGLDPADGLLGCATTHPDDDLRLVGGEPAAPVVRGVLTRVPWGAAAGHVVALARSDRGPVVVLLPAATQVERGANLADEPRDTLRYADVTAVAAAPAPVDAAAVLRRGALLRAAATAGAAGRVLELALAYAGAREQFGRPIATFQAVQHHLVVMAEEVAAVDLAVRVAALAGPDTEALAVAAAKVAAGTAAAEVTRRGHQVFGAIGATIEHPLHHYSKRLWSWQDEFGTDRQWSGVIGRAAVGAGADALWPTVSAPLDPAPEAALR
ncbi:acyl-CoA dehydrogenase [Pseudonocardia humida]|uniref:Acyl-CoA dehydrogenase n=1 Tax=Pseudonocardia humida TaxID=2800819 RepID=A0ABT1A250_9PSEU|nr:acyl-CoA dehydrogenase [Pseudonocardia humida]MCO1657075.1 acyl-CoA dehydrogenase [Pseudonocardia humida]